MPPNATRRGQVDHDDETLRASTTTASSGTGVEGGKYTWQEVAKHNTPESAWVIVDGTVYDVTEFLPRHPGGSEMMLLAAGRECTDLFNMYHWYDGGVKSRGVMAKYEIGKLVGPTEFPAYAPDTAGFYAAVSKRVREYFERTYPEDPKGATKYAWPGMWRLAIMFAVAAACYGIVHGLLLPGTPFALKALAAVVFGVFQAMPLMHAMHDACHTSLGGHQGWWKTVGRLCLDWYAGGCMITWHHQHVIGHHVYTNIFQADPDIPSTVTGDLRKHVTEQESGNVYAWQWLYLPLLYGFLGVLTRIQDVAATWLSRTSGPIRVNYYGSPIIHLLLPKALWVVWRVLVPLLLLGVPHATFWPLLAITEVCTGFYLAWNFEVSHVADTVAWPKVVNKEGRLELPLSWAHTQVATSVDYAHNSWWEAWWSGALNYQIEHHLFPGISQYHYPSICGIVKATAEEFKVPYQLEPTFWAAWKAHVRLLWKMGKEGREYKMD